MGTGQVQPGKPDYDQALKRLLLRGHSGFLSLIDPSLTWQGELSPELPAVARHADLVWEVGQPDGQRGILHIEIQTKVEADIGERVAEYGLRLWRREHRPVWSVVLFLRLHRSSLSGWDEKFSAMRSMSDTPGSKPGACAAVATLPCKPHV